MRLTGRRRLGRRDSIGNVCSPNLSMLLCMFLYNKLRLCFGFLAFCHNKNQSELETHVPRKANEGTVINNEVRVCVARRRSNHVQSHLHLHLHSKQDQDDKKRQLVIKRALVVYFLFLSDRIKNYSMCSSASCRLLQKSVAIVIATRVSCCAFLDVRLARPMPIWWRILHTTNQYSQWYFKALLPITRYTTFTLHLVKVVVSFSNETNNVGRVGRRLEDRARGHDCL